MQVGILTLLFNKSESCPLLLGLFLNEGCVQRFWIGGLFVGIGGLFEQQSVVCWVPIVFDRRSIVSVRSHDYDVGEKLVPPYWRSEICHATPRVL